jgi:hypothetical protein
LIHITEQSRLKSKGRSPSLNGHWKDLQLNYYREIFFLNSTVCIERVFSSDSFAQSLAIDVSRVKHFLNSRMMLLLLRLFYVLYYTLKRYLYV